MIDIPDWQLILRKGCNLKQCALVGSGVPQYLG